MFYYVSYHLQQFLFTINGSGRFQKLNPFLVPGGNFSPQQLFTVIVYFPSIRVLDDPKYFRIEYNGVTPTAEHLRKFWGFNLPLNPTAFNSIARFSSFKRTEIKKKRLGYFLFFGSPVHTELPPLPSPGALGRKASLSHTSGCFLWLGFLFFFFSHLDWQQAV